MHEVKNPRNFVFDYCYCILALHVNFCSDTRMLWDGLCRCQMITWSETARWLSYKHNISTVEHSQFFRSCGKRFNFLETFLRNRPKETAAKYIRYSVMMTYNKNVGANQTVRLALSLDYFTNLDNKSVRLKNCRWYALSYVAKLF